MKKIKLQKLNVIKLAALALLLLIACNVEAQTKFGVKSTYGIFSTKTSNTLVSTNGISYSEDLRFISNSNSKSLGVFFIKDFKPLFIQTDLLYTSYNSKYMVQQFSESIIPDQMEYERFKNFDLSIIAGLTINCFKIGVGPVFHKNLDLETDLSKYNFFINNLQSLTAGFQLSIGYILGPLHLEIRAEDMFSQVGDHFKLPRGQKNKFDNKQSLFQFQVGLAF